MDKHEARLNAGLFEYGPLIFFWGIWSILAIAGMYGLELLEKEGWTGLNWVVFIGLGWIYTVAWIVIKSRSGPAPAFPPAAKSLGTGCGIASILLGLIFPLVGLYPFGTVPPLVAAVLGVLVYGAGGLTGRNLLKAYGTLWWFGSLGMIFVPEGLRALILVPLILAGLLPAAFVLRRAIRDSDARARRSPDP